MNDLKCPNCKETVSQIEIHCENCNFPLAGTAKEKSIFIGQHIARKSQIGDAKEAKAKAQRILYIVGGLQLFNAILTQINGYAFSDTLFYVILGVMLIVFGYFSGKKPLLFLTMGLALIVGYYTFLYVISPEFLFRGILWKIVIIAFLVYGIWNAMEEIELKKKHKFLKDE